VNAGDNVTTDARTVPPNKPEDKEPGPATTPERGSPLEVLAVATRLGLTSFGGPVAHLGYFREEYVNRRRWIDEATYADLIALSQFLPGPASSKLGVAIGIIRAGLLGGLLAWVGFTLPSAILLTLFAYGVVHLGADMVSWLHGLQVVAVAVVAQAVWGMARSLCPDRPRITLALLSTVLLFTEPALGIPVALGQIAIIVLGAVVGWWLLAPPPPEPGSPAPQRIWVPIARPLAVAAWIVFFGLLIGLPLVRTVVENPTLDLVDSFFRSGALVFGGGHIVLPLLQAEVVPPGWITDEQFLAGYGAAQAVPGPLFTFSAYLGASRGIAPNGWLGAGIALLAIFLPALLMVVGSLPFWERLRGRRDAQAVLRGVNAAVVGLLLAALYQPVWTSAIHTPADFSLGLVAFGLLVFWRVPPWIVVVMTAIGGALIVALGR
jgi:chromate transporter